MPIELPPDDDEAIKAWVAHALAALDQTPRNPRWRHRAVGMSKAQAAASAGRHYRLDLRVPTGEMRLVNDAALQREIGARSYLRRALGTIMVVCEGVDPQEVPYLTKDGLIGPH